MLPPPKFLGAMSSAPRTLEVTATGVYVVTSIIVASYASSAISRLGVRGYAGAWRVGAIAFCLGSWTGIYASGTPLVKRANYDDPDSVSRTR